MWSGFLEAKRLGYPKEGSTFPGRGTMFAAMADNMQRRPKRHKKSQKGEKPAPCVCTGAQTRPLLLIVWGLGRWRRPGMGILRPYRR